MTLTTANSIFFALHLQLLPNHGLRASYLDLIDRMNPCSEPHLVAAIVCNCIVRGQ
jgi:hypothetical protein